jgi:hypothetical protein
MLTFFSSSSFPSSFKFIGNDQTEGELCYVHSLQSFPRSVGHVAMSSKNWFDPVKGYSLLDQRHLVLYLANI